MSKPSLSLLLYRCSLRADELLTQQLIAAGLTPRQLLLLEAIRDNKGISQVTLVEQTEIDRSTLAEIVTRMVDHGLVTRERRTDTRRTNALAITKQGLRALKLAGNATERAE